MDPTTHEVKPVAAHGSGAEYLSSIRILDDVGSPLGQGPTGVAMRTGESVWSQDFCSDPRTTPWHAQAEPFGWRASAAVPVRRGGRIVGALGLYASVVDAFDADVRLLFERMAGDIGFALDNFDREAERRRVESMVRLQSAALTAAANAIVITDRDGTIEWVNPAFTGVCGYTFDEAIGRNPRDLVKSGEHDAAFYRAMWDTLLSGRVWQGELVNRRKDGTHYVEEQTITPLLGAGGDITHFIGVKRDLTEQKRLQEQLVQAQKMEVIGRLAGGVAHDFNNLLTVINCSCELGLLTLEPTAQGYEEFTGIQNAAERAARLTGQLLAFSRRQLVAPSVISLSAHVRNSASMLHRLIGEDIELAILSGTSPVPDAVRVDTGQLEQIVLNLAVNARDAMPDGGRLSILTQCMQVDEARAARRPGVPPGHYVLLTVTDTGVGMTDDVRQRLFEPFFTTKTSGRGTGLGLATVHGIVAQCGGHIEVESAVGRGTTFRVFLPRVDEQPEPRDVKGRSVRGTETILLVEDEDALRDLTRNMLRAAGYEVLAARNGTAALALLESHDGPLHLLLTDVVLPGMSGPDLASRVTTRWPATKVLFMSGYVDEMRLAHEALKDPARLIMKPYTFAELTARVRQALDRGRQASPSA